MFGFLKKENIKLYVDPSALPKPKNIDGSLGKVCSNCGGYGYTLKLKGGTIDCYECNTTGVGAEGIKDMKEKMDRMQAEMTGLKKAVIAELRGKGLPIPEIYK